MRNRAGLRRLMLFAGLCRFFERVVMVLMLVTTWEAVNWAATLVAERRVSAAVATVLNVKRIMADVLGWKLSD
jgi:hypothetical protein